jgi:hypothetical protein
MENQPDNKESFKNRNSRFYGGIYPGIWLIVVGGIFLLNNFGFLRWNAWGKLWPLFIIITGFFMIFRPRHHV